MSTDTLVQRMPDRGFFTEEELALSDAYLSNGYVMRQAEDEHALRKIRDHAAEIAAHHLGLSVPDDRNRFLNGIADHVDPARLNDLRLAVIQGLNSQAWFRPCYFQLARSLLGTLVGNELVMQRRVNLSIQLPHDDSSLLPVHADVWAGDSSFEVVVWLPLVDCYRTKAMYLTPPEHDRAIQAELGKFSGKATEDLYRAIEPAVQFIEISYGQVLLFNHNLMHGNRVNREPEARWSLNCRFKSVFSPYADKRLGEFFEPITLRAATRIGMAHSLPSGFEE